jgi:hypothetical protein
MKKGLSLLRQNVFPLRTLAEEGENNLPKGQFSSVRIEMKRICVSQKVFEVHPKILKKTSQAT